MFEVLKLKSKNLWIVKITIWTFFLAVLFTLLSQNLLGKVGLFTAFLILFFIIFLGIIFDIIGVATTVASIPPLNAKAAKRVIGAKQALFFVRNSERVASFCCDVIGDISGIVSGSAATVIIISIFQQNGYLQGILLTSVVAAITVGGKAIGKTVAMKRSADIMIFVGKITFITEKILKRNLTNKKVKKRKGM